MSPSLPSTLRRPSLRCPQTALPKLFSIEFKSLFGASSIVSWSLAGPNPLRNSVLNSFSAPRLLFFRSSPPLPNLKPISSLPPGLLLIAFLRISILIHGKELALPRSISVYRMILFVYLSIVTIPYLVVGVVAAYLSDDTKGALELVETAIEVGYILIAFLGSTYFLVRLCIWLGMSEKSDSKVMKVIRRKHIWISMVNFGFVFVIAATVFGAVTNLPTANDRFSPFSTALTQFILLNFPRFVYLFL